MAEDRDIISNEEHELNYVLKKWGKKTSEANRKILSDALDRFNDDPGFETHNRENFYKYAEQNKIADSMESGAKKDSYTLTEVTGDFKTGRQAKKSILWIMLLIILAVIVILLVIFGLKYCSSVNPGEKTGMVRTTNQDEDINRKLDEEAAKKAELEKAGKISEIIKQNTPVYFVMDRPELLAGEENKIKNLITLLKEFKNLNLTVEGHTAGIGAPDREMNLSIERAEKIRKMLDDGLKENSFTITARGYGAQAEAVPSSDRTRWQLNRRVEIKSGL